MQPTVKRFVFGFVCRTDMALTLPPTCRISPISKASFQTNRRTTDDSMENKPDRFMIVGLGNHDMQRTRHSVGMQVVDKLADCLHTQFGTQKQCCGCVAQARVNGIDFILLKPKMPMNVNGSSIAKTANEYNIPKENIYLLHDDIDRQLGSLAIKEKGSANGHNGVRSALNSLKTDAVTRIKIGIDRPATKDQVAEYVLEKFPVKEQMVVDQTVKECVINLAQHLEKRTGTSLSQLIADIKAPDDKS